MTRTWSDVQESANVVVCEISHPPQPQRSDSGARGGAARRRRCTPRLRAHVRHASPLARTPRRAAVRVAFDSPASEPALCVAAPFAGEQLWTRPLARCTLDSCCASLRSLSALALAFELGSRQAASAPRSSVSRHTSSLMTCALAPSSCVRCSSVPPSSLCRFSSASLFQAPFKHIAIRPPIDRSCSAYFRLAIEDGLGACTVQYACQYISLPASSSQVPSARMEFHAQRFVLFPLPHLISHKHTLPSFRSSLLLSTYPVSAMYANISLLQCWSLASTTLRLRSPCHPPPAGTQMSGAIRDAK